MKRQATDHGKIFENHISNEGLVSRILKYFQISTVKNKSLTRKWAKGMKRCFTEEIHR